MLTPMDCWAAQVILIYGKSGWIGGLLGEELKKQGIKYEYGTARLEDRAAILADIERVSPAPWRANRPPAPGTLAMLIFLFAHATQVKPTHVMNCAGVTGRPNVDWCESNRVSSAPRRGNYI